MRLDSHDLGTTRQPPATRWRKVCIFVAVTTWRTRSQPGRPQPPRPRCAAAGRPGAVRAQARGGGAAQLPCLAVWRPSVPAWVPRVSPAPRPALRVAAAPSPGPLHLLPRPGPAWPLPSDPALPQAGAKSWGCEPRHSCPWAGTGGGCAGSPGGERAACPVRRLRPRWSPASCRRRPPRRSPHRPPPPPPQPWRKFIDVSMPGLKEKPPRNPPHTDMRRSWGWRRPKR